MGERNQTAQLKPTRPNRAERFRKLAFSTPGKVLMVCIGLAFYALVFIYPLQSLSSKLHYSLFNILVDSQLNLTDALILFGFAFPLLGRLVYQATKSIWSRHFMAISMTWSGFVFFLLFPVIFLDLSNLAIDFNRHTLANIAFILVGVALGLGIYGIVNANFLIVNRLDFSDARIPKKTTAIQLSDVHIGSRSKLFIHKLVRKVNKLKADRVFITGDLVDLSCIEESDLAILKEIESPVYFVTGNHDRYVNLDKLLPILERQDFNIIRNKRVSLEEFDLVGIDDAENPRQVERVLPNIQLDKNKFTILLYHRPQGFDFAASQGIDLMLSGHTHYGQIVPFNFMVGQVFKDIKGTIKRNGSHLHVSTGTSTWGPIMRIGSSNEITFITFSPAT